MFARLSPMMHGRRIRAESRRRARDGHRSRAARDHSRQPANEERARNVRRAVPRGRRRRGGRVVGRGGADSRRVLAGRDRGAGDHGAARRHRRHRRDDAVVGGARPHSQLRARALSGVPRHARRRDAAFSTRRTFSRRSSPTKSRRPAGCRSFGRRRSFRSRSASTRSCANSRRAARTSRSSATSTAGRPVSSRSRTSSRRSSARSATSTTSRSRRFEQEGSERYWVSGRLPLDELAERLNTDFGVDDVDDGRWTRLRAVRPRAASPASRSSHAGFRIVVERVRRRRIERVYFERLGRLSTSPERRHDRSQPSADRRARRRRLADGRRHGGALGEPHLAAPLGRASASRRRGGGDLPRAAAPPAHGRQRRRRRSRCSSRGMVVGMDAGPGVSVVWNALTFAGLVVVFGQIDAARDRASLAVVRRAVRAAGAARSPTLVTAPIVAAGRAIARIFVRGAPGGAAAATIATRFRICCARESSRASASAKRSRSSAASWSSARRSCAKS